MAHLDVSDNISNFIDNHIAVFLWSFGTRYADSAVLIILLPVAHAAVALVCPCRMSRAMNSFHAYCRRSLLVFCYR